jgi:hypothetical protein
MARTQRRAENTSYLTTATWEHAKEMDVEVEKGKMVRFEVPDLHQYVSLGTIPNPFAAIAAQIDQGAVAESKMTPDERKQYFELECWVIATHLRRPNLIEELGEEEALKYVKTKMHPDHRAVLWSKSVHHFAPEEVLRSLGELVPFLGGGQGDDVPSGGGKNGKTPQPVSTD